MPFQPSVLARRSGAYQMIGSSSAYFERLKAAIDALDLNEFDRAVDLVHSAWRRDAQIITLGNGGSAMTALHFITDWSKMIFLQTRIRFRGRSLVDNMGLVTAYSNDLSFADLFAEQLKNIMQPGDLIVAISGSGNSENVIRAVDYANANQGVTLGISGFSGGRLKEKAQHSLWVNVHDMQICEDLHSIFGHIVMQTLCKTGASTAESNRK